ncbi:MAG: class I SAM-dependent methyltransferase, partial [Rhizobiales bacterium]|nr:class I SAM-dependent methyltransferase [Hyphomicrobiales bacterium]
MYALLDRAFRIVMKKGNLRVTAPSGRLYSYGDAAGNPVAIRISSETAARRIAVDPDLALGEAYMDGTLTIESGGVYDLLALLLQNAGRVEDYPRIARWMYALRVAAKRLHQHNTVGKAKANVAHHYDLNGALYDLFLDRDRQYSCAYF